MLNLYNFHESDRALSCTFLVIFNRNIVKNKNHEKLAEVDDTLKDI